MKLIDLTGKRFGRLTVIERCGSNSNKSAVWRCRCDCGKVIETDGRLLREQNTVSCGCSKAEKASARMKIHGMSSSLLYDIWSSMKARCSRSTCKDYPNYGGRGITVYPEWNEFQAFYDWALSAGYKEHLTIERSDVNGSYCPDNCCWIPNNEQSKNRRISKRITYLGQEHSIMEWSVILGIKYNTLKAYISRGMSLNRISSGGRAK